MTSGILSEFIPIVTDSRRFHNPLAMQEALEWSRFWSGAQEVILVPSDHAAHGQSLRWLDEHHPGRKHQVDTLIAATWHAAGIREIITLNPRDFEIFGVFSIHRLG